MISVKKWYWVLLGTVTALALWTFISVSTGIFKNNDGTFEYVPYIISYILVLGFWGFVALKIDISEKLYRAVHYAMFILAPFFCMEITMILSGAAEYSFGIYFINIMFYYVFMALITAVTREFTVSAVITVIGAYLFNLASFVVNILRGTPLIPADFLALGTAAEVAENYSFDMRYQIVAATVVTALAVAMILRFKRKPTFNYRNIILPVTGVVTAALFFGGLSLINYGDTTMDLFDQQHANNTHGTPYSFYINVRRMVLKSPRDYSGQWVRNILAQYEGTQEIINTDKPDIIVIMNESLADLKTVGEFETNIDYMPAMRELKNNTVKGELLVSPFGGYTCNTEFEFLTNISMNTLPAGSTPYLQYISKPMDYALPKYMESLGYKTAVLHPYYRGGWNREKVYSLMGFNDFIGIEDMDKLVEENQWEYIREYLSDKTDYEAVERYLETRADGKPVFMFNITMQNHGGYTYEGSEFPTVTITDMEGHYSCAEQYLSLVRESDKAFADFVKYLKLRKRKTIVLIFGDHLPAVEQEFYEELYGKRIEDLTPEELQKRYKVPFIIWANYDIDEKKDIHTSTNYLSDLLLDTAGIQKNNMGNFTEALTEKIPQINAMGYYDETGNWNENNMEYDSATADYKKVGYYLLTGKEK